MKIQHLFLTLIAAAAFVVAGCSKTDGSSSVDTAKLSAAFQAAEADAKTAVESVTTAVKNADYAGAITQLKALGDKYKLTPEQQKAVSEVVAQVQKAIEVAAGKATAEAGKAATDLGNAIKK
jgi:PBP1b-binding outer membrane lipoprotein LpoB